MMKKISEELLKQLITKRKPISHKGDYGRLCLIGGDQQYGGAIILASQAAIHAGAGLVTTITDQVNHSALHARLPEAMVLDWQSDAELIRSVPEADVVLIGPGLGLGKRSLDLLKQSLMLLKDKQICIIDGSAITLVANYQLRLPSGPTYVFTPHEKEWERLSGLTLELQTNEANRLAADKLGGIVVLKKHRTEVFFEDEVWQNPLGTPAMATAGMGDTLAGMIAGFIAQFSLTGILAAVYLHSYIGEVMGEKQYVVLPTDIISQISSSMKQFEA